MYTPVIEEILRCAGEHARACGDSYTRVFHVLIAACRLSHVPGHRGPVGADHEFLKGLFLAGRISPADLAEKIGMDIRQGRRQFQAAIVPRSKQCQELFLAAEEYASEQSEQTVGLRHLVEPLFVALSQNPYYGITMQELGGSLDRMLAYLDLDGQASQVQEDDDA